LYVNESPGFVRAQHGSPSLCKIICGKYLPASAAEADSFQAKVNRAALLRKMFAWVPASAAGFHHVTFRHTTWQGRPALCAKGSGYNVCAANHGTPYLIRIAVWRAGRISVIRFSEWNRVTAIAAPPKNKIVSRP
jgi:hypothetical protein